MRVLIIGGGIGGLTTAIALRAKGIDCEVFEKSPELREVGAGISLWPNAVKALRKLALGDALDSISLVNRDGAVRRSDGVVLSRTLKHELEQRFGGGVIVLHRSELLNLLAENTSKLHLGHTCVSLEQDPSGVTATFENGVSARGDVLIGADGLHSVVRAWLGHNQPARYRGYTAWRAVVPFETSSLVPGESWGRGLRFGFLPVKGNRVYWFATSNAPEGERDSNGSRARLLSTFNGWHEPIAALIRAADESTILRNDIYDRDPLAKWGRGRVTLLGDAAHPMTPNLGQGGCQAIEDAVTLATCLSRESNIDAALTNYESRRLARANSVVIASRRVGAMAQIESPILCGMRNLVVRMMPNSATLRTIAPFVGYEGHLAD